MTSVQYYNSSLYIHYDKFPLNSQVNQGLQTLQVTIGAQLTLS